MEERRDYRESQKDFRDLFAVTETAEKKGRAEGRAEEKIENARKMIAAGVSEELVLSTLGLTKENLK